MGVAVLRVVKDDPPIIDSDRRIEYTRWWLQTAHKDAAADPTDTLHQHTHPNVSGGICGWEEWIHGLYTDPRTPEEWLLRSEVHEVLLTALRRTLHEAHSTDAGTGAFLWLEVAEAYRLVHLMRTYDPLLATAAKIELNRLCQSKLGESLLQCARKGFRTLSGPKEISF
ncbi:hypothetical protein FJY94_02285 [Candidatus Kaiserbacteria bacterium]|nr:hypothetical protein [Candidatus Kaiserbacteria bacterium]